MNDEIATRWLTREDVANKTVSYAQNHEDILLDRVFEHANSGTYVDVGANDPVFHSVTKLFHDRGWRGINIEPNPALHRRLVADRPDDVNLNLGISDLEGTLTFFEVASPLHGWSTFMPEMAESYRRQGVESVERPIPVTTLDRVFERHVDRPVDVLKVDAEGFERRVLAGFDPRRWRPRVILVEALWADSWEHVLLGADYLPAAFDGINRYYVRPEDRDLLPAFAAPVNVLDNFIPHEVLRLIRTEVDDFGPTTLSLARGIRRMARRHPRVASVVKRIVRGSA